MTYLALFAAMSIGTTALMCAVCSVFWTPTPKQEKQS
jgi:hypothetical protein